MSNKRKAVAIAALVSALGGGGVFTYLATSQTTIVHPPVPAERPVPTWIGPGCRPSMAPACGPDTAFIVPSPEGGTAGHATF